MINGIRLDEQNNQVSYADMKNQVLKADQGMDTAALRASQGMPEAAENAQQNSGIAGNLDSAIQRALTDAGLPVNEKNAAIVKEMLNNQMSIDSDSLRRVLTQANMYKEADISTLLLMNKNNIPVTHFTAAQLQAYINNEQNLSLQVGEAVTSLMEYLASETDTGSVNMNMGVLQMLTGNVLPEDAALLQNSAATLTTAENVVNAENGIINMLSTGQGGAEAIYAAGGSGIPEAVNEGEILNMQQTTTVENVIERLGTEAEGSGANWMNGFGADQDGTSLDTSADFTTQTETQAFAQTSSNTELSSFLSEAELRSLNELVGKLFEGAGTINGQENAEAVLRSIYENALGTDNARLEELFKSPVYQKLIGKALGDKFSLKPEDIRSSEELNEFYRETYSALEKLSQMADKEGSLAEKLSKPMDNIKFMDTLNDVFPYIQLPLKMAEGNTRGELYVFKKGRTKSDPGDSKSVLLHLDMKSLGPTDIHMELKSGFLKLRFYCNDDSSKELLEQNFVDLEEALYKKNFNITSEFNVRTEDTSNIVEALSGTGGNVPEFKYNFDIRA